MHALSSTERALKYDRRDTVRNNSQSSLFTVMSAGRKKVSVMSNIKLKSVDDFVYNKDKVRELMDIVKHGNAALLDGPPGTGKSEAAKVVADELGYDLEVTNASDHRTVSALKKIKVRVTQNLLAPTLFFLDEIDGVNWNRRYNQKKNVMVDMLKNANNPVVMAANEGWKLPQPIKKYMAVLKFKRAYTYKMDVEKILRKRGIDVGDIDINKREFGHGDIRDALNKILHGGDVYKSYNPFTLVERTICGKWEDDYKDVIKPVFDRSDKMTPHQHFMTWLLHNAAKNLYGRELIGFIKLLVLVDKTKKYELFSTVRERYRKEFDTEYPRFYRRLGALL